MPRIGWLSDGRELALIVTVDMRRLPLFRVLSAFHAPMD